MRKVFTIGNHLIPSRSGSTEELLSSIFLICLEWNSISCCFNGIRSCLNEELDIVSQEPYSGGILPG